MDERKQSEDAARARREAGGGTDRLRSAIDRGETGDKVIQEDPAAAPLGTDDEAAGTPADADRIALAQRRSEAPRHGGPPPRQARLEATAQGRARSRARGAAFGLALIVATVGLLAAAIMWLG